MDTTYISPRYSTPSGIQQTVSTSDAECETVKSVIPNGVANAIPARLIIVAGMGWDDTPSNLRRFRKVVHMLREKGVPVTATTRGYYRARNSNEFAMGENNKMKNALAMLTDSHRAMARSYTCER